MRKLYPLAKGKRTEKYMDDKEEEEREVVKSFSGY
jgi:hypothetical protein